MSLEALAPGPVKLDVVVALPVVPLSESWALVTCLALGRDLPLHNQRVCVHVAEAGVATTG